MTILTQILEAKPTKKNIRAIIRIAKKEQFKEIYDAIRAARQRVIKNNLAENRAFKTQVSNEVDK